ncbi:MAG TPA: aminoglycoside phosphotransferase family protein [Gemmatimonadales bacterium]|nr:aminoglycoside phosphotransferase family protein [Gemmatimonadales bacterium]
MKTRSPVSVRERLERLLKPWQEPGATELCDLLEELVCGRGARLQLERLKPAVYRLRLGAAPGSALVLKRHPPAVAQADRLVVERWLPALELGDGCPRLLGAAAEREGGWVWHVYEDLGDESLARARVPWRLDAAVDFIAELHLRAARHPLIPEVRWRARDHGVHFFTSNVRDAIAVLEALATPPREVPRDFAGARERLLGALHTLLEDAPRRVRCMQDSGGPDTLLHGDLWPKNIFVARTPAGPRARLIDWDHVGVGPVSYDVSTLLYQSAPDERPAMLRRYLTATERQGCRLPDDATLNLLFHTAECARYAHCIVWAAMALLHDGAEWGIAELIDFDHWFRALRPPLPP